MNKELDRLLTDYAKHESVRALFDGAAAVEQVAQIAHKAGYAIDAAEARMFLDRLQKAELTDGQLDTIAGGMFVNEEGGGPFPQHKSPTKKKH